MGTPFPQELYFGKCQQGPVNPKSVLMGAMFQWVVPIDDGGNTLKPPVGGGETLGPSPPPCMVGIHLEIHQRRLVWGKGPPRGVNPFPEMGKCKDAGGSGIGPPQNRGLLRGTEWPRGGKNCGLHVSGSIGVITERDAPRQQVAEQENKLWML